MNTPRFSNRLGLGALFASTGLVAAALVMNGMSSPAPAAPVGDPCDVTAPAGKVVDTFTYTGGSQTFVVPAGVTSIDVDVCGAEGGSGGWGGVGGKGAHAKATVVVAPGDSLVVQVGGTGADGVNSTGGPNPGNGAGYNGGGSRGDTSTGGGGGASDIRTGAGGVSDRVVVAGGGGGGGGYMASSNGGDGGLTGSDGLDQGAAGGGKGGAAAAGGAGGSGFSSGGDGALGSGGEGALYLGGAGGGGYYGGGGGATSFSGGLQGGGGGGGSSLVTGSVVSGGSVEDGVVSGNGKVAITYPDTVPPTVTVNQWGLQDDPTTDENVAFEVVFSEPVTGFTSGDVNLTGTASPLAAGSVSTSDNQTFVVTTQAVTSDGTVIATVPAGAAKDAAGNDNTASTSTDNTVTVDTTAPAATINQASGQDDPTNVSPVKFDVKFSEDVTGLQDNDVSLSDSTAPGSLVATVTGSGDTYTVSVTGMTGPGTVVAKLSDEGGVAEDAAGNEAEVATWTDNEVTYEPVDPTGDPDGDGLTNAEEDDLGTDPNDSDTDNDGLKDGRELAGFAKCPAGTDPLKKDTDADGLADYAELSGFKLTTRVYTGQNVPKKYKVIGLVRTNPCAADTDGDKLSDASEVKGNTINQKVNRIKKYGPYTIAKRRSNPLVTDTDKDGLSDRQEVTGSRNTAHGKRKSDPTVADTDWGGAKDGVEIKRRSDPTQAGDKN